MTRGPAQDEVLSRLKTLDELYHRLLLLVAPSGGGKTGILRGVAERIDAPLLNLNLELSEKLLDLTQRERALKLPTMVEEVLRDRLGTALLDNIEILFDVSFKQDPLRLLQKLSRYRTIVASWNGTVDGDHLVYAQPGHPEFRRYSIRELVLVCPEVAG